MPSRFFGFNKNGRLTEESSLKVGEGGAGGTGGDSLASSVAAAAGGVAFGAGSAGGVISAAIFRAEPTRLAPIGLNDNAVARIATRTSNWMIIL